MFGRIKAKFRNQSYVVVRENGRVVYKGTDVQAAREAVSRINMK